MTSPGGAAGDGGGVDPLATTDHRPWPLPRRPWRWRQTWHDLLFAHWPVAPGSLRSRLPEGLALQTREGAAWVGIVPFHMTGIARRPLPPIPGLRAFPELNVRTYVERGGKPGVWFFSLDADSRLAVRAACLLYRLPYRHASMATRRADRGNGPSWIHYSSVRRDEPRGLSFRAQYRPVGPEVVGAPDTLDRWLTERYCLYSADSHGRVYRAEIHHRPWPLQAAEVEIRRNEMLEPLGLDLSRQPALVHFARRLEVRVWPLTAVDGG